MRGGNEKQRRASDPSFPTPSHTTYNSHRTICTAATTNSRAPTAATVDGGAGWEAPICRKVCGEGLAPRVACVGRGFVIGHGRRARCGGRCVCGERNTGRAEEKRGGWFCRSTKKRFLTLSPNRPLPTPLPSPKPPCLHARCCTLLARPRPGRQRRPPRVPPSRRVHPRACHLPRAAPPPPPPRAPEPPRSL